MAGLLDFLSSPSGIGLLSAVAGGMSGARRGTPWNNTGRGLVSGLTGYTAAQDQIRQDSENALTKQYKTMQMQEIQDKIAKSKAEMEWKAGLPGVMQKTVDVTAPFQSDDPFGDGIGAGLSTVVGQTPDVQARQDYLMQPDSPYADDLIKQQLFPQKKAPIKVGERLIDPDTYQPVYEAPMQEDYNKPFLSDGRPNPAYQEYATSKARAGATSVTNRIENKVGDSIAGQVGPILKASTEKTTGAINLANSSRLMIEALNKGNAYIGPTANARLKLAQFGQVIGVGGKTDAEKINNTRQLIRSLAEGAVEARKELAGQGQVTESEAAAVQKAYSGNIEDLTAGEIRLIAGLNIKREKLARERHARAMKNAPEQLQPFYQVDPEAPANTGGGWGITRVK